MRGNISRFGDEGCVPRRPFHPREAEVLTSDLSSLAAQTAESEQQQERTQSVTVGRAGDRRPRVSTVNIDSDTLHAALIKAVTNGSPSSSLHG